MILLNGEKRHLKQLPVEYAMISLGINWISSFTSVKTLSALNGISNGILSNIYQ